MSDHLVFAANRVAVARHGSTPSVGLLAGGITCIVAAVLLYAFNDKIEQNTDQSKGLPALQNVSLRKSLITIEAFFLALGIVVVVISLFVRNR